MKVGKILIVMIFAALGFQLNAQRAVYVNNAYNYSISNYIRPLGLTNYQVADWRDVNEATYRAINSIERDRGLSSRARARKIESVLSRQDRRVRNILSRRQYDRFISIHSNRRAGNRYGNNNRYNNGYNRGGSYNRGNSGYYGGNSDYYGGNYGNYGNSRRGCGY